MNIMTTEKMNKQLFDEWQEKLFRFVFENKRKFTEIEWRWMRYQFEIEHLQTAQNDEEIPFALAADGDTVRVGIRSIEQYKEEKFTGILGDHTYTISITPRKVKENVIIYIKGVDENNNAAENLRIKFCNVVIELNERGRCQIGFEEYKNEILNSLGLGISMDGANFHELIPGN